MNRERSYLVYNASRDHAGAPGAVSGCSFEFGRDNFGVDRVEVRPLLLPMVRGSSVYQVMNSIHTSFVPPAFSTNTLR